MDKKPKIVWLADQPGWAYDNRAKAISGLLSDFDHEIVLDPVRNYSKAIMAIAVADLLICPDPRLMAYLPMGSKTILHLNAIKIFT